VIADPVLEGGARAVTLPEPCTAASAGRLSKVTRRQPLAHDLRMAFEPRPCRDLGLLVQVQDGVHHLTLAGQAELQVSQQPSDVGQAAELAGAGIRVDRRPAEVGPETASPPVR